MRMLGISMGCLLLLTLPAQADVYKWKDEKGRVHFSDQAPQNKTDVKVLEKKEPETSSASAPETAAPAKSSEPKYRSSEAHLDRQRRMTSLLEQDRKQKSEERKRKQTEKEKLEQECKQIKSEIDARKRVNLFVRHDKGGGVQYLSDEERVARDSELERTYQEKCAKLLKEEERKNKNRIQFDE